MQMYPLRGSEAQKISGRTVYFREVVSRVTALPGVEGASYSHMGPLLRFESKSPTAVSGSVGEAVSAVFELVGPGFFEVVGVRVLQGRDFLWSDDETRLPVAVISDSLARCLFPGADAVGRRIDFGDKCELTVIGVASNASLWKPDSREPMAVYRALLQETDFNSPRLNVRIRSEAAPVAGGVKRTLEALGYHTVLRERRQLRSGLGTYSPHSGSRRCWHRFSVLWRCCWQQWGYTGHCCRRSQTGPGRSALGSH